MRTLDEINAVIADSSYWVYGKDKCTVHLMNTSIKYLTHDELQLVDARLPYLVQALPVAKRVGDIEYKEGFTVYITTQYWNEMNCTVVDKWEKTLVLAGIEKIDDVTKEDTVIFYAHTYELLGTCQAHVDGQVIDIPYAGNTGYGDNEIAKAWLEENLPNWKSAWASMLALGIDVHERQRYLITAGKSADITSAALPADLTNT